jgi:hypothetical protein
MAHTVVIPNRLVAKDVDSYVRPVVAQQSMDNGNMFSLLSKSTGSAIECWIPTVPTTGSLNNLWMALEPEVPFLASGVNVYAGLGTIRDFYITASAVFTAVLPRVGDIITVTSDFFTGGTAPTSGQYACAWDGKFTLTQAATTGSFIGAIWVCRAVTYIPSADGSVGTGRITAYQLELVQA